LFNDAVIFQGYVAWVTNEYEAHGQECACLWYVIV